MLERFYLRNKARFGGKGINAWTLAARAIAWCFEQGISFHSWLYEKGWRRKLEMEGPVIAVGSFFVGGAGKTPFCILLGKELQAAGVRVGFVARGYRANRSDVRVLSRGEGPELSAQEAGDEPLLISQTLPEAPFVVGRNRCAAARLCFELGAEVVIADDALQHRRLNATYSIELRPPWAESRGRFFPRGERRDHSRPVDAVVYVDCPPSKGEIGVKTVVSEVRSFTGSSINLSRMRVAAFAGIAHPERFFKALEDLGADLICRLALADHGHLEGAARSKLIELGQTCDWIVCTQKDIVKLDTTGMNTINLATLYIEHQITEGRLAFDDLVREIAFRRRQKTSLLPSTYESN